MIENIIAITFLVLYILTIIFICIFCFKLRKNLKKQQDTIHKKIAAVEQKINKSKNHIYKSETSKYNTKYIKSTECCAPSGSLLVDKQIKNMCEQHKLIYDGYNVNNVESISYNLTIDKIRKWALDKNIEDSNDYGKNDVKIVTHSSIVIHPHEMVFVTSKESIKLPGNIVGRVMTRNSYIRTGLLVSAPLYQPGHITKINFSVYNMSENDIKLSENDSIAHIFFEFLNQEPEIVYGESEHDEYQNEDDFRLPYDHIDKHVKETSEIDKKISHLESKIYTVVTAFMGAFISVLSLLVVNFNALAGKTTCEIIKINLSLAACIIIILGVVLFFGYVLITLPQKNKKKRRK